MTNPFGYPKRPLRFRILNAVTRLAPRHSDHFNNILLRRPTADAPRIETDMGYEFVLASAEDLAAISDHREALRADIYRARLAAGDRCYCLKQGSTIVCYNWVRSIDCCLLCGFPQAIHFLPLPARQAFSYDLYTYETYRGRGIASVYLTRLIEQLAREGVTEVRTLIAPHNTASLKVHLRLGYDAICMVYAYRVWRWRKTWYGSERCRVWIDDWIDTLRSVCDIPPRA